MSKACGRNLRQPSTHPAGSHPVATDTLKGFYRVLALADGILDTLLSLCKIDCDPQHLGCVGIRNDDNTVCIASRQIAHRMC